MSDNSPIVSDNSSPGWRLIGSSLPSYTASNMLWDGATNNISFGGRTEYYLALPSNTLQLYNSGGDNEMEGYTSLGTKVINKVTYYIYKCTSKAFAFGFNIYSSSSDKNYYWYIGQTDPTTMTAITPIVSDNSSPGWRLIGSTLPSYSSSNMLWDGVNNSILFEGRDYWYVALPSAELKLWNGLGTSEMGGSTSLGTKVINGITYYIYKRNVKAKVFGFNIF
jgi:hypothetical protein